MRYEISVWILGCLLLQPFIKCKSKIGWDWNTISRCRPCFELNLVRGTRFLVNFVKNTYVIFWILDFEIQAWNLKIGSALLPCHAHEHGQTLLQNEIVAGRCWPPCSTWKSWSGVFFRSAKSANPRLVTNLAPVISPLLRKGCLKSSLTALLLMMRKCLVVVKDWRTPRRWVDHKSPTAIR